MTPGRRMRMQQKRNMGKIGLVVLFFLVGGFWYVFRYREDGTAEPEKVPESVWETPYPAEGAGTSIPAELTEVPAPTEKEDEPSLIYVYVCGAVKQAGVYALEEGARLYMAVELAGGFLATADESYHNLARQVYDGERLYILSEDETEELSLEEYLKGEPESSYESGSTQGLSGPVNLNTADVKELMTLPGIGQAKAESILEYRDMVGGFTEIEELMNINGIGEAMFEKLKDKIIVK